MQTFQIHTKEKREATGDLFGIFFEDINHAADGGLYAELIQNRAFEFDAIDNKQYHALYAWEKCCLSSKEAQVAEPEETAELKRAEQTESVEPLTQMDSETVLLDILTDSPYTQKNPHYLRITAKKPYTGVENIGFNSGIALAGGETYHFSCYLRKVDGPMNVKVCLIKKDGTNEKNRNEKNRKNENDGSVQVDGYDKTGEKYGKDYGKEYASCELIADSSEWKKYTADFVIPEGESCTDAHLALVCTTSGSVEVDFVSLFPAHTYKNRINGLRKDLCEMLEAMHPKFIRFPGGCLVHDGQLDSDARDSMYRWKNTIGPVEQRPARRNNWGYNQTLGLGYFEYFQLAEDIGAEPLPVLPAAYDPHHQRKVPFDELGPWIDDALDLIEFANGDETTVWGKKRADMGHPKPFGLKYLAIGNEEVGEGFTERYPYFHKAIREKYPEIKLIGSASPFAAGGEYERGWASARECGCDLIDEHYYMNTDWMIANVDRYDNFSANDPKVFLGEYASWGNQWQNGLSEAAFMTGLEKNVHAVGLACYAPMFANVDYVNWRPDMIWFDNHQVYGSVNYYVQSMFMRHQGTHRLDFTVSEPDAEKALRIQEEEAIRECAKTISGPVRLKVNEGQGVFFEVTIQNNQTGKLHRLTDCVCGEDLEKLPTTYENAVESGVIPADWTDYTLTMKAKETAGRKGFMVYIGDRTDHMLWTLGGWQNLDISLEHFKNSKGACLSEAMFAAEKDHEYELKLVVSGRTMKAYVDGVEYLDTIDKVPVVQPLYVSAVFDEPTGDIIVKAVNITGKGCEAAIALDGISGEHQIQVEKMVALPSDENTMEEKKKVVPVTAEETIKVTEDGAFEYAFEPYSLTVLRIHP